MTASVSEMSSPASIEFDGVKGRVHFTPGEVLTR